MKNSRLLFFFGLFLLLSTHSCVKDNTGKIGEEGEFSLSLSIDKTDNPITPRSGNNITTANFKVQILSRSGNIVIKEWAKYSDMPESLRFGTGKYIIKAIYGDSTLCGFEEESYSGESELIVTDGSHHNVEIICKHNKLLVSIDAKDGFKSYYKDYSVDVKTTNKEPLTYIKDEVRRGFFEVGDVSAKVYVTRDNDSKFEAEMPAVTQTKAGDHYKLMLDVNDGAGSVTFTFTNIDTEEVIESFVVPLSASSADPPYVVPTGFSLDVPNIYNPEYFDKEVKMLIKARGFIKTCKVSVRSSQLIGMGLPNEFDMANTSLNVDLANLLKSIGFVWSDKMKGSTMAEIDLSNIINKLYAFENEPSEHVLIFEIEDSYGRSITPIPVKFVINQPLLEIKYISIAEIGGTKTAEITINTELTNGKYSDISKIEYQQGFNWTEIPSSQYTVVPNVDNPEEAVITISGISSVSQTQFPVKISITSSKDPKTVRVTDVATALLNAPEFNIDKNNIIISGQTVTMDVSSTDIIDPAKLKLQVRNQGAWENIGTLKTFDEVTKHKATMEVRNLTLGEQYRIRAVYDDRYNSKNEAIFQLSGYSFENFTSTTLTGVQQGGRNGWASTNWATIKDQGWNSPTVSIKIDEPMQGWASVNKKTAYPSSSPRNSWYITPSMFETTGYSGRGVMLRSVLWDNLGPVVADYMPDYPGRPWTGTSTNTSTRDNVPIPDLSQAFRSSGKLLSGTYNCVHSSSSGTSPSESYGKTGFKLRSRPLALTGYYKFNAYGGKSDIGMIKITLYNSAGNIVGDGEFNPEDAISIWSEFRITINYKNSQEKVDKMVIECASSKDESKIVLNTADKANCVAIGNILEIDEFNLAY